jgi:alanine-glyoxylate transaminase/serine-glyoxylate transaminase/serine-pyruvate transaminase
MDRPTIDHRGLEFADLTGDILDGLRWVFGGASHVFVYPASGSGSWEAALVNTLSAGDRVMAFDHGFFAAGWGKVAQRLGLDVQLQPGDWRRAVAADSVEALLRDDASHAIKAVLIVHNETSTGVTANVADIRRAMNAAQHPALLMVDAVSSLGSMEFAHDAWGVDVTVAGSQKGLMLPPGLSFTAVSDKALSAGVSATLPRSYWRWDEMLSFNERGFFPYTPATNLLFGLREALAMLREEGQSTIWERHARLGEATRRAVVGWGLETYAVEAAEQSHTVTAVLMPTGYDADALRKTILERYDMSLGAGLGKLKGLVFRIGHLGDLNALTLAGALCGVEMGLVASGLSSARGGVAPALDYLTSE